eukprot:COSAG02_NODE_1671_length_11389_cov_24.192826_3_plen_81_part_00
MSLFGQLARQLSHNYLKLISVDANVDQRFEQAILRGSKTDKISKEQFKQNEEREWTDTGPNKQNLKAVVEMSDVKLLNDV